MSTLSVRIPAGVSPEVIRRALESLGAQIVERVSRKAKAEVEFVGMAYKRTFRNADEAAASGMEVQQDADGDWYAPMEMDGVSVLSAIRKMDNARNAYNRRDGRESYSFPQVSAQNQLSTAEYVELFCRNNNLSVQS